MEFSKIGTRTWSEPGDKVARVSCHDCLGFVPSSEDTINNFKNDINEMSYTNSVGDLLQLTRQRGGRQYMPTVDTSVPAKPGLKSGRARDTSKFSSTKNLQSKYQNIHERPPRRLEVAALESSLSHRVQIVMEEVAAADIGEDNTYQSHRDQLMLVRDRVYKQLGVSSDSMLFEPWLEQEVRSECLKELCDEVASTLTDMLSVSATELGNVLRKLRYTYNESFLLMQRGWLDLRSEYVKTDSELQQSKQQVSDLSKLLQERDYDIREKIDLEVSNMRKSFEAEREKDREKIYQVESQKDQMAATLKNLNAIFKTMQSDIEAARAADTFARCTRLEREVADLEAQCAAAVKVKLELDEEKAKNSKLETLLKTQQDEIANLKLEIERRDVTVSELMERETVRNAEIDKLQRMATQKTENDEDLNMDPAATSVLCIRCKKSLDDLSTIRDAILGAAVVSQRLMCQSYRILLPNLRGRRPDRKNTWLRGCMRAILTNKMNEITSMLPISGEVSGFPEFVYAWFEPVKPRIEDSSTTLNQAVSAAADEDRWGLYYGVKALAKDDPEAKLFWALLDETHGEDGLTFVCHCLSVVLSLAGNSLWKQFGKCVNLPSYSAAADIVGSMKQQQTIWLDLAAARSAVKVIFVRAMESHVAETLEAIDVLKTTPTKKNRDGEEEETDHAKSATVSEVAIDNSDATHIDLFLWLRVLLQRYVDEQCHREAAIRLMFDTASMGALTSVQAPNKPQHADDGSAMVHFPQFVAVLRTLYPAISMTEVAALYSATYQAGQTKVTAKAFIQVAQERRLFSRSMKFAQLPLFVEYPYDFMNVTTAEGASTTVSSAATVTTTQLGDTSSAISTAVDGSNILTKNPSSVLLETAYMLRMRTVIGALVHRKFALMLPEINALVKFLPERWRCLIREAADDVTTSLQDYFVRSKEKRKKNTLVATRTVTDTTVEALTLSGYSSYIDGLQPFIKYQRLLCLIVTVKSFSDNALVPHSYLTIEASATSAPDVAIDIKSVSLYKAEQVLTTLEETVLLHLYPTRPKNIKYMRLETCRRNVYCRKIQRAFRRFRFRDAAVPAPMRMCMRAGYLRGEAFGASSDLLPVKQRRVYVEPWVASAVIAGVYGCKIAYDCKAAAVGRAPCSLAAAASTYHLSLFHVVDVAERMMQDLCTAVITYMHGVPRLRMFGAFLGFGDLEEPLFSVFRSDIAVDMYLELLLCIHYASAASSEDQQPGVVPELFPVTEDPIDRSDKRDVWRCSGAVLKSAVSQWSASQRGVDEKIFVESLPKVKLNSAGEAEVDDFLWVMMMTWAKGIATGHRKCDDKVRIYAQREIRLAMQSGTRSRPTTTATATSGIAAITLASPTEERLVHFTAVSGLKQLIEGVYSGGSVAPDTLNISYTLMSLLASAKYAGFSSLSKGLRGSYIWDGHIGCFSPKSIPVSGTTIKGGLEADGDFATSTSVSVMSAAAQQFLRMPKRLSSVVISTSPPLLLLRVFQFWWTTYHDPVTSTISQVALTNNIATSLLTSVSCRRL